MEEIPSSHRTATIADIEAEIFHMQDVILHLANFEASEIGAQGMMGYHGRL